MALKLYEISQAYQTLLDTEELNEEELSECLKNIEGIFTDKARSLARLVLSLQAEKEAVEIEANRLAARAKSISNRIDGVKNYLAQEMRTIEIDKIKDDLFTISLRSSPPSVRVDAEDLIPQNYWREIPARLEVDKQAILKSGEEVPGVTVIRDKKYLVIK